MFGFGDNVDHNKLWNSNELATVEIQQIVDKAESRQLCRLLTLSTTSSLSPSVYRPLVSHATGMKGHLGGEDGSACDEFEDNEGGILR